MTGARESQTCTVLAQGVDMASQLAITVIVGRTLGPQGLGEWGLAFAVAGLLAVLLQFGTGDVAIAMHVRSPERSPRILGASLSILRRGFGLVLGTIMVGSLAFGVGPATFASLVAAGFALGLNGLGAVLNHVILARGWAAADLPGVVLSRVLGLAAIVGISGLGSVTLVIATQAGSSIVLAGLRADLLFRRRGVRRPLRDRRLRDELWRRGRKIGLAGIFGSVSARSDNLVLKALSTATQLGFHAAAQRIANGAVAGVSALASALYPAIVTRSSSRRLPTEVLLPATVIPAGLVVVAAMLRPSHVAAVFGGSFLDATPVLRLLLLATALQTAAVFATKWLIVRGHEQRLVPILGASAVVAVALNIMLVPTQGALGAARATLASEGLAAGLLVSWLIRDLRSRRGSAQRARSPAASGARAASS